ncbi:hypothetical protein ACJX0J_024048, partial [Zea mays]
RNHVRYFFYTMQIFVGIAHNPHMILHKNLAYLNGTLRAGMDHNELSGKLWSTEPDKTGKVIGRGRIGRLSRTPGDPPLRGYIINTTDTKVDGWKPFIGIFFTGNRLGWLPNLVHNKLNTWDMLNTGL